MRVDESAARRSWFSSIFPRKKVGDFSLVNFWRKTTEPKEERKKQPRINQPIGHGAILKKYFSPGVCSFFFAFFRLFLPVTGSAGVLWLIDKDVRWEGWIVTFFLKVRIKKGLCRDHEKIFRKRFEVLSKLCLALLRIFIETFFKGNGDLSWWRQSEKKIRANGLRKS